MADLMSGVPDNIQPRLARVVLRSTRIPDTNLLSPAGKVEIERSFERSFDCIMDTFFRAIMATLGTMAGRIIGAVVLVAVLVFFSTQC